MQSQRKLRSGSLKVLSLAVLGAGLLGTSDARAQIAGTSKRPLPDIMLLVDNSGSMEHMPNGSPTSCTAGTETNPNRWGMLLQALTGNIYPYFSCNTVDRKSAQFKTRYKIGSTTQPYDADYAVDYHQPVSGTTAANACVVAPWKLPGAAAGSGVGSGGTGAGGLAAAYPYPDEALAQVYNSAWGTGLGNSLTPGQACVFEQGGDGQLDVAKNYARFGLMTFDNDTAQGTGVDASGFISGTDPFGGMWSYLRSPGSPDYANTERNVADVGARGRPSVTPACPFTFQEIGARNYAAPPWEGRMMPFPGPDVNLYELAKHNEQVQNVILATRPYGATPIDGMLDDARNFFWVDPKGPNGTTPDPYTCREKYIILLTDGAPNLDLRPQCTPESAATGACPFAEGWQIVKSMFEETDEKKRVTTFVIGFSVNGSSSTIVRDGFPAGLTSNDCKTWFDTVTSTLPATATELDKAAAMDTACTPAPVDGSTADACCKLNKIARYGSGTGAFFAESQADIVLSFGRILANIIHDASTKTVPAYSSAQGFSAATFSGVKAAGQFIGSFIPSAHRPWSGEIDRTRFVCGGSPPASSAVAQDTAKGDLMSENVSAQAKASQRRFLSILPEANGSGAVDSAAVGSSRVDLQACKLEYSIVSPK